MKSLTQELAWGKKNQEHRCTTLEAFCSCSNFLIIWFHSRNSLMHENLWLFAIYFLFTILTKKKSRESNTFWLRRKLIPYLEKRTSHIFTIALNKVFWLHALIEFVLIGIAYILWGVPNKKLTVHKLRTNGIDLHRIRTNRNWIATNMVPKNMTFKSS